jgi:hypothetical protein
MDDIDSIREALKRLGLLRLTRAATIQPLGVALIVLIASGGSICLSHTLIPSTSSLHAEALLMGSCIVLTAIGLMAYKVYCMLELRRLRRLIKSWESQYPLANLFASHPDYSISREQKVLVAQCKRGEASHVIKTHAREYVILVLELIDHSLDIALDRELAV